MEVIHIYKLSNALLVAYKGQHYSIDATWSSFVNRKGLFDHVVAALKGKPALEPAAAEKLLLTELQAPIDAQEVWAAGVTYYRSRTARMEESEQSGGATFYDKVYVAERPELFFKATARRVSGHGQPVYIRTDSTWDVPEPELTLFISSEGTIEGYTIGNDMSSRSIEGENPLYLPQAKIYEKCAGLGPCLAVPDAPIPPDTNIRLTIYRNEQVQYTDNVPISQMKRGHQELVGFLYRSCSFPEGAYLMTGTCLVPGNDFTLHENDRVEISIDHIGVLVNDIQKLRL